MEVVIVAGEACPPELAARWAPRCRMYNGYGPTETTVVVNIAALRASNPITLGTPACGVNEVLLDPRLHRLRPVLAGECGRRHTADRQLGAVQGRGIREQR